MEHLTNATVWKTFCGVSVSHLLGGVGILCMGRLSESRFLCCLLHADFVFGLAKPIVQEARRDAGNTRTKKTSGAGLHRPGNTFGPKTLQRTKVWNTFKLKTLQIQRFGTLLAQKRYRKNGLGHFWIENLTNTKVWTVFGSKTL